MDGILLMEKHPAPVELGSLSPPVGRNTCAIVVVEVEG